MEATDAGGGGGGTLGGAAQVAGQMESEQDAMASPAAKQIAAAQPLLPDEILEDIFLLLDSGADLARASASCRSFRRVATGRRFLRRFLSIHPPPLVGIITHSSGHHGLCLVGRDHQSAPATRAIAQASDFTFSFLPSDPNPNRSWIFQDVRGGRFLFARNGTVETTFLELVVCDPLYRRYILIPPIPGDLVPRMPFKEEMKSEPFLAPAGDEEEDQNFLVIYNFVSDYKIVSFNFSASAGKWCGATSFRLLPARLIERPKRLVRYYARSCFYWMHHLEKYMLMLDPREMKFSLVKVLYYNNCDLHGGNYCIAVLAIVDSAEGRLGLLAFDKFTYGSEGWRHDKYLPFPQPDYGDSIIGAAEGYILLSGAAPYEARVIESLFSPTKDSTLTRAEREVQQFIVNLKTLMVEWVCVLNNDTVYQVHPYASFPPPLSLPSL